MYDIVIRGGSLIDGSGSEPTPGDLAIENGLIVAVGEVDGKGKEEIDATGQMVTPGFIDIHTHLDAQIGWDPDMTPISWHGVTTALIGNCGVTFAPCKAEDRELLAGMMETVEDIPKDAILSGLAWDWEHYPEYLDSITRLGTAVNVAGLVGHSAVRYYVMGERAVEEQATDDEKKQMAAIAANAVQGGAFGFSTNRYEPHKGPDGRSIPGTFADVGELIEIAGAIAPHKGLMQAVGANFEVLSAIADIPGARVLFSYGTAPEDGAGKRAAEALDQLCEGRDVTAISHVRGSGYMFGLQSGLPFKGETWRKLADMDFEARRSAIENDEMVQALIDEARAEGSHVPMERVYYLGSGDVPDYTRKESLMEMAGAAGEHWSETFIRLTRESDGRGLFNFRMFATNLKEQADLFRSKNIYPGLGDAGAHVSQIMDAGWSTFLLSHWTRESGEWSLGETVRKMTSGPAKVIGLEDRGLLKAGMKADVNVFDFNQVSELQPVLVHDFPHGAPRYIQKSRGFTATIVNGKISLRDGELTGTRAGVVLRHGS